MKTKEPLLFKTESEVGSLLISDGKFSVRFSNGIGDVTNFVKVYEQEEIYEQERDLYTKPKWLGVIEVEEEGTVYLSDCDWASSPTYYFRKGAWVVYLVDEAEFVIVKIR